MSDLHSINQVSNMGKKHTIETCQEVAKSRGGLCLSDVYTNAHGKMRWKCGEGHIWEARFCDIKNKKGWCGECYGVKKLTLDDCKKTAHERGGECLSTEYVNNNTYIKWRCEKGHEWDAPYSRIRNAKTWCAECVRKKKLTIEICRQHAEKMGGKCLSTTYKNVDTYMKWRCKEGHVWTAIFDHMRRGTWCPDCVNNKTEKLCRKIIEELTGKKFSSVRPDFLQNINTGRNLELDGYNEEMKLAFEYNGIQHYKYRPDYFHKGGEHLFIDQQENDKLKIQMCNNLGIKVIVIPYQYNYRNEDRLRLFIKSLI
jgi:hypothetical protein